MASNKMRTAVLVFLVGLFLFSAIVYSAEVMEHGGTELSEVEEAASNGASNRATPAIPATPAVPGTPGSPATRAIPATPAMPDAMFFSDEPIVTEGSELREHFLAKEVQEELGIYKNLKKRGGVRYDPRGLTPFDNIEEEAHEEVRGKKEKGEGQESESHSRDKVNKERKASKLKHGKEKKEPKSNKFPYALISIEK